MNCKSCGAMLPADGRGRPRAYCSIACRRLAEFQARRVARAQSRIEAREKWAREPNHANFANPEVWEKFRCFE